jgi:hypothetical protein
MNKLGKLLLASTALTGLAMASALAASSGNYTAGYVNDNCTINSANGTFTTGGTSFPITYSPLVVQISSGSGTGLVVTPSGVTGLYTDNKLTSTNSSSTEDVGIQVQVTVTPINGTVVAPGAIQIAPHTAGDAGNNDPLIGDKGAHCDLTAAQKAANAVTSCVIYDQRFIQVSSSVLTSLASCTAGVNCFELVESTLSAHSFNFYVEAPGGTYQFDVNAQLFVGNNNNAPTSSVAGCYGPGTVTVEQVKNFSFDTPIVF